jgi:hypothetical protein
VCIDVNSKQNDISQQAKRAVGSDHFVIVEKLFHKNRKWSRPRRYHINNKNSQQRAEETKN